MRLRIHSTAAVCGRTKSAENGFTLVEVMVSTMLVTIFFASIFELNAMCLRCIDSSKESLAALQSVQDRSEVLRNLAFADLTTNSFVQNLLATTPANPAPFSQKATEVVTISNYHPGTPLGASEVTQFERSPNGSVTPGFQRTVAVTDLVQVDVSVSWSMTMGGRTRTEQTSSIVSNGTKK